MLMQVLDAMIALWISLIVVGLVLGFVAGFFIKAYLAKKSTDTAKIQADKIIASANEEAEKIKKQSINEAKEEVTFLFSNYNKTSFFLIT